MGLAVEAHRQCRAADRADLSLVVEPPLGRHRRDPPLEQVAVVDLAELSRRVERAQADVARAVTDAEDPAIARQQDVLALVVLAPQLHPGLEPVVLMAWAGEVRANGHAHRPVVTLGQAEGGGEPAGVAVSGDHHGRGEGLLRAGGVALVVDRSRPHADHPVGALVQHRAGDRHALEQSRTRLLRVSGQRLVEVLARPDQPVVREGGQLGPGDLHPHAAADDPQALVADPAVFSAGRDAEGDQLLDRSGRQAVATDLLAREGRLLQQQHVQAGRREVRRGRRPRRTRSDDDHVCGLRGLALVLTHRPCRSCCGLCAGRALVVRPLRRGVRL